MVVRTRPPQTPVMPRSVADAPRRWPRRVALTAALTVLLAIGISAGWLANVEPLTRGSSGFGITDPTVRAHVHDVSAMGVTGSVQSIAAKPGMQFRYRFSLRNDGPLAVTITSVGASEGLGVTSAVVAAKPDLFERGQLARGFDPFEPFTLAPGAEAGIEMLVSVPTDLCIEGHGGFESWYTEPVAFTVVGIARHTVVDTGTEIRLLGTRATRC